MAEAVSVSEETVAAALTTFVRLTRVLLREAERDAADSLEKFVPNKISTLFGLMTAGTNLYRSLGVKRKSEAEAVWQKSYHHEAVREQLDELLQLESDWDSFLESVDRGLQTTDGQLSGLKPGDSLSPDVSFSDGRSGKSVTLGEYLHRGQKLLLVLIRHFG